MLTNLHIRNFKSWKDTGSIRLAPITVFFGANSAGKTSLLQFLLMLKQTCESSDRSRVVHFGDDYSLVELGTFEDLIFGHDLKNKLEFDLSWTLPKPLEFSNRLRKRNHYEARELTFRASIASEGDKQYVEHLEYAFSQPEKPAVSVSMSAGSGNKLKEYKIVATGYDLKRNQGRPWPFPPPVRFYGFPDEVSAFHQNAGFTGDLTLALERQLKRILYLGPLRDVPKRSYTWAGDVPEHVGRDGDGAVAALLAASERKISGGYKQTARPFQVVIAEWLKQLGLLDAFVPRKIAQNRKDYEVRVKTKRSTKDVDLTDVGFGISQVLPVVVESFYVAPHSTVIIEQPELHLHPRVQSELADLFVAAAHAREGGDDRCIQFLIESHSEHFLQRLQRRIAEGILQPKDVALYFCEPGSEGSELCELQVNSYGDIENWPSDFFGDPTADLSARMEAAASREAEVRGR
jgi:predicted ATPase